MSLVGLAATLLVGGSVAGIPAAQAAPEAPVCSGTTCSFTSPSKAIFCTLTAGAGPATPDNVYCEWGDGVRAHSVKMLPNGSLDPCINPMAQEIKKCQLANPPTGLSALGYGQTAALGPFKCLAEAQAISCTVVPAGRGFTMNSSGILPVLPPPPPPPPPAPEPASDAPPPPPPPDQPDQPAGQ